MLAARDGFEHQSRQDELFARFEIFSKDVMHMLEATVQVRDLTACEIEIMQALAPLLAQVSAS